MKFIDRGERRFWSSPRRSAFPSTRLFAVQNICYYLCLSGHLRCYGYFPSALDVSMKCFEQRDVLGFRDEFSEGFWFLESAIRLSYEPGQPFRKGRMQCRNPARQY